MSSVSSSNQPANNKKNSSQTNNSSATKRYPNPLALNLAASLGGFLCTVVFTILITLIWPFGDDIEKVFAGGMLFFVIWSALFYWIIISRSGKKAWLRVLFLIVPTALLDAVLLFFA